MKKPIIQFQRSRLQPQSPQNSTQQPRYLRERPSSRHFHNLVRLVEHLTSSAKTPLFLNFFDLVQKPKEKAPNLHDFNRATEPKSRTRSWSMAQKQMYVDNFFLSKLNHKKDTGIDKPPQLSFEVTDQPWWQNAYSRSLFGRNLPTIWPNLCSRHSVTKPILQPGETKAFDLHMNTNQHTLLKASWNSCVWNHPIWIRRLKRTSLSARVCQLCFLVYTKWRKTETSS